MYEESNTVELKRELINKVKNEILAFVNTDGGTVYIGVDDNGNPMKALIVPNMMITIQL